MAEYPNNSYNAREKKPEGSGPPDKKLEKVVSGGTKTRKKSEVKKFANIFVPEDVENVKSYILIDVIVPGIKNEIAMYDDIVFETRGDADLVLDQLESAINTYGIASVADLYDLAGITCRSYTANKYGWSDIRSAKVVRIRDGYILELPRTVQIN